LRFCVVNKFVNEDRLPHLLLYGPPGTGKTSTILAVARQIYSPKEFNSMVLEVLTFLCNSHQYFSFTTEKTVDRFFVDFYLFLTVETRTFIFCAQFWIHTWQLITLVSFTASLCLIMCRVILLF